MSQEASYSIYLVENEWGPMEAPFGANSTLITLWYRLTTWSAITQTNTLLLVPAPSYPGTFYQKIKKAVSANVHKYNLKYLGLVKKTGLVV